MRIVCIITCVVIVYNCVNLIITSYMISIYKYIYYPMITYKDMYIYIFMDIAGNTSR